MDLNSPVPNENTLRRMTYSELQKVAKSRGMKVNIKAEKLISKLLSLSSDDMDIFSTPQQKEMNSSKKNKEKKFDEDKVTPLTTPRRGTYSVESPLNNNLVDEVIEDSSSPPDSKSPVQNISNITICRGSDRKLRPRKVSFMSPKMTPRTSKYISLKDRPQTPIPSRNSGGRKVSFSFTTPIKPLNISQNSMKNSPHSEIVSTVGSAQKEVPKVKTAGKQKRLATPGTVGSAQKEVPKVKIAGKQKRIATPGYAKKEVSQVNTATKLRRTTTPSNAQKTVSDSNTASKLKRVATPNFQEIHKKAFDKMESLDDYHKRKLLTSAKKIAQISKQSSKVTKAKSKIPTPFSGIPFIPSATSCAGLKINFASTVPKSFTGLKKNPIPQLSKKNCSALKNEEKERVPTSKENVSTRNKKFDLKASLSRKLGYKPYSGPLKPLAETNVNSPTPACYHTVKEGVNKVVHAKRSQTRVALCGVRTNKRFELQMKNRKVE